MVRSLADRTCQLRAQRKNPLKATRLQVAGVPTLLRLLASRKHKAGPRGSRGDNRSLVIKEEKAGKILHVFCAYVSMKSV